MNKRDEKILKQIREDLNTRVVKEYIHKQYISNILKDIKTTIEDILNEYLDRDDICDFDIVCSAHIESPQDWYTGTIPILIRIGFTEDESEVGEIIQLVIQPFTVQKNF